MLLVSVEDPELVAVVVCEDVAVVETLVDAEDVWEELAVVLIVDVAVVLWLAVAVVVRLVVADVLTLELALDEAVEETDVVAVLVALVWWHPTKLPSRWPLSAAFSRPTLAAQFDVVM